MRFFYDKVEGCYNGSELDLNQNSYFPARIIGNFIEIEHKDGTISSYQNLMKDNIKRYIKIGQEVEQGDLIALSGLSGWIGPVIHFHFCVFRRYWKQEETRLRRYLQTIPVKFADYNGPLEHRELFPNFFKSKT